jgi:hypothetical protein
MTKITLIKANILRMNLTLKKFKSSSIPSIIRDLEDWYSKLPEQMGVTNILNEELEVSLRRTICHVHLLYLGTVMLLYRRVTSHVVKSCSVEQNRLNPVLLGSQTDTVRLVVEKGLQAAQLSARILSLLFSDNGVFRRCWLVM